MQSYSSDYSTLIDNSASSVYSIHTHHLCQPRNPSCRCPPRLPGRGTAPRLERCSRSLEPRCLDCRAVRVRSSHGAQAAVLPGFTRAKAPELACCPGFVPTARGDPAHGAVPRSRRPSLWGTPFHRFRGGPPWTPPPPGAPSHSGGAPHVDDHPVCSRRRAHPAGPDSGAPAG